MALPVLDGNQSATTLSSVVTGGEHIVAHTVVSLGSTAISNITSAVSGSVVSVSNFPATQTIAGTVTANVTVIDNTNNVPISLKASDDGFLIVNVDQLIGGGNVPISGTVTANSLSEFYDPIKDTYLKNSKLWYYDPSAGEHKEVQNTFDGNGSPLPISGTVTVGNSVTIGSLPTLTPQLPRVTFIDGSGTVVTANSAVTLFASSSTRSYLLVQVTTGSAFVNVGATATTVNGINLTAGQGYAWETTIPQGLVSLISTTTSSRWVAKEA